MLKQTLLKRELFVRGPRVLGLAIFCVVFILVAALTFIQPASRVQAATNNTLNFQARLQTAGGALAADGYYNIEFKLYSASSGGSALWTETHYDSNGVTAGNDNRIRVKNGYLTVSLGSITAFPSTINWDQELWVTMNVGGATQTATPTFDGEMSPRLKLTGVPYAFRAGELAKYNSATGFTSVLQFQNASAGNQTFILPDMGVPGDQTYTVLTTASASGSFIQNSTTLQNNSNFHISGDGKAVTSLQTPLLDTISAGTLSVGTGTATGLSLSKSGATTTVNGALTVAEATTLNGNLTVGNATTDRLTVTSQILGGSPFVFQGATDDSNTTTLSLVDPTGNNIITLPDASGTVQLAPTTGSYIQQVPSTTADNTITPTAASVVGLTVNATNNATGAIAAVINQSRAFTALDINTTNTAGTQTNGVRIVRNGAGGTTTNLLNLTNTTGTATHGLTFTGTFATNLINAPNFTVSNGGAVNAVGVTSTAGLTSSGGAVALSGNAASSLTTSSGALTLTSAAAATWSTTAGDLTLQGGSGTVSLGTSTNLTSAGALSIRSGGTGALSLDTSGAAALSIGTTNASSVTINRTGGTTTIYGATLYNAGGVLNINAMPNFQSTGTLRIGRTDGTLRYSDIVTYNDSTAANNYIKFSVHNGTLGSTTDVLTLSGDATASFAGSVSAVGVNAGTGLLQGTGGLTITGATSLTGAAAGNGVSTTINTGATTNTGLVIKGAASQTADMFQIQDSTGANLIHTSGSTLQAMGYIGNPWGGVGVAANLILHSEAFDNAAWVKTNVTNPTANTITDPRGSTGAESLATSGSGGSVAQTSSTATSNTNFTFAVWLKTASGTQNVDLRIDGATSGTGTAKTVTTTATWQRFWVTQNTNGFSGNVRVSIFPGTTSGSGTVHASGAQLSQSSGPVIYVSTTTGTLTSQSGLVSSVGLFVGSSSTLNGGLTVNNSGATFNAGATITTGNGLTLGSVGVNNGGIIFRSSNVGSGAVTLRVSTTQGATARTLTLPDEDGVLCVQSSANCGFALSTGGTGYIQNQDTAQQASSNFWISGVGRADTAFAAPAIRPTADSTTAFQIQGATGSSTVLVADTSNLRIGVGAGAAPEETLDVSGNLQVKNAGDTKSYRLRTSGGALDLEAAGANMVLSVWSGASYSGTQYNQITFKNDGGSMDFARGFNISDAAARVGLGGNLNPQYTLDITGTAQASTSFLTPLLATPDVVTGTSTALTIRSGNATAGNGNSGNVSVDVGSKNGTGTAGTLSLGATNASAVIIGNSAGTLALNSDTFNLSSAGAISGVTDYAQAGGNFAITGAGTFSTGTGAISLNGDTTIANDKRLSIGSTSGLASAFAVTAPGGAELNVKTNGGLRVSIGDTASCTNGRFCVEQAITGATAGTFHNSYNTQTITSSGGANVVTAVGQQIVIQDTGSTAGNEIRGLFVDTTGTTNAGTAIQGLWVRNPSSNTGNLLRLQTGTTDRFVVNNNAALAHTYGATSSSTAHTLTLNNTTGTQTNALLIDRNGSGGTTTNLINLTNTAGTVSNAINISSGTFTTGINLNGATFTNLIDSANFNVSNAGAITAVGVNSGSGLLQGSGGLTVTGAVSLNGNTTVASGNSLTVAGGTVAFQKGTDYSTTGTSNDVNLGNSALVRLTGASAQTITGIAGGVDGRLLTIINAGSATAVISNNSGSSTAANRITTGTGGDINLTVGASISLVYDSTASLWRVTGASAATGGSGVNTIGTFNSGTSYANGAQISGTTLTFGAADATNPGMVSTAAQTFAGDKTFNGQIIGASGISSTGGAVSLTGNAASSLTTSAGALTLTSAAAATWSTAAGDLTLQAGSGTVTLGSSTTLTANGALTVRSTGATDLTLDTGGAATLNLGNTNATTINLGGGSATQTLNIGNSSGNDTVNIATGTGTDTVNIGSTGTTVAVVGATTMTAGATSVIPLTIQGIASQTASLLQVKTQSSGGTLALNIQSDGSAAFLGAEPAAVTSGNGTAAGVFGYSFTANGAKGGNTSAAGQTGGNGGSLSLTGGAGGNATGGTGTAGSGGSIVLQGGAPGTGTTSGFYGNVNIQANGGYTGFGMGLAGPTNTITVKGLTTGDSTAQVAIGTGNTGNKGMVIQGVAGQTANIFELQDSTGAAILSANAGAHLETMGNYSNPWGGIGSYGNLLVQSEAFDNASWTKTNITAITADTIADPIGTTTAEVLATSSAGGNVRQTTSTAPTNNDYTFSVWMKTASGTQSAILRIDGATTGTGTAKFVTVTTTWQRFFVTQNTNGFTGNIRPVIFPGNIGTGTVHAWGASLQLGSNPGVYVPTTTSTVAAGTGISGRNIYTSGTVTAGGNISAGSFNNLTLTSAADGFTVAGGTTSRTLTVTGANITVGSTIQPTSNGALAIQSTGSGNNMTVDTGAGSSTLNLGTTNAATVAVGNSSAMVNITAGSGNINLGAATTQFTESASTRNFGVQTRTTNVAGTALTISAGTAGSGASAFVGGALTLQGGNAAGTGNANGGNVNISGGTGVGTGARGLVVIDTPTVNTTTTDANCGATTAVNCTIAAATVNNTSSVIVGASTGSVTISMPDPTITTAGRIFYFTAANGSQDFTLSLNGGGTGNTIAMRQNTTATLIWNGSDWTAAGASSSTTLQSAYDSTLSSAGGAEIVLNNSASSNGLTIRNNATSPIAGGLLEIQTSIGSNLFSVNNNATEYANNGGAESSTFTMWTGTPAGGTVSQSIAAGTMATGQASVSVVTTTTNHGAENTLTTTLTNNLQYTVSFTAKAASSSFSTLDVLYSQDGTNTTACATGKTVTTAIWTRVSCTFTAPASGITASNSIFIRQSDGTGRTFYIDNLSVTVNAGTNHAADGSVDLALGSNWTPYDGDSGGAGTTALLRDTTTIYDTSGSVQDDTSNHANMGLRNNMSIVPSVSTQYLVSFYARSSTTFNDIQVGFLPAGGNGAPAAAQLCSDYNTRTVSTTGWTKITCIITTPSSGITDPDLVIYQPTGSDRIFYVDALTISLNTNTASNVQVGGGSNGGPATLFTLDRSATAPIAANNDAYLGSMYYDTVTGRIQCYEADGWGACGAAPDTSVVLTPEYTGAVLNGTGVGTLTADFCSNQAGILSVNTSFCASGLARNYYKWTSPQSTMQTYSIYVSYKLPSTFKTFNDDSTINLTALTDSTSNGSVTYEVFRSSGSAVSRCYDGGTNETAVTSTANTWQTVGINGNEATSCSFTANDSVIFKINVKAQNNANVYVENLSFVYTNK